MKYLAAVLLAAVLVSGCGGSGGLSLGPVSMMPDEPPASTMPDEPPASTMPDGPPASTMPDEPPASMPSPDTAFMTIGTATAVSNPAIGFHPYSYGDWGFRAENDQGETIFKATLNTPDVPVQDTNNPFSVYDPNAQFGNPVTPPTSGSATWNGKVRAAAYTDGWAPVEGTANFTFRFPIPAEVIVIGGGIPVNSSFTSLRTVDGSRNYSDINWSGTIIGTTVFLMGNDNGILYGTFYGEDYLLGGGFNTNSLVGHFAAQRQ